MDPQDVEPLPTTVEELSSEEDAFLLAIRAHAEVEQLIAMAIESLFVDHTTPDELKHLGFTRSLSLAISLAWSRPKSSTSSSRSQIYETTSRTLAGQPTSPCNARRKYSERAAVSP